MDAYAGATSIFLVAITKKTSAFVGHLSHLTLTDAFLTISNLFEISLPHAYCLFSSMITTTIFAMTAYSTLNAHTERLWYTAL